VFDCTPIASACVDTNRKIFSSHPIPRPGLIAVSSLARRTATQGRRMQPSSAANTPKTNTPKKTARALTRSQWRDRDDETAATPKHEGVGVYSP
jgi:hypothetical protein